MRQHGGVCRRTGLNLTLSIIPIFPIKLAKRQFGLEGSVAWRLDQFRRILASTGKCMKSLRGCG